MTPERTENYRQTLSQAAQGAAMYETQSKVEQNLKSWHRTGHRNEPAMRTARADIKRMDAIRAFNRQNPLLLSVPLRGTAEWEQREELRKRLGNKCLSFGAL